MKRFINGFVFTLGAEGQVKFCMNEDTWRPDEYSQHYDADYDFKYNAISLTHLILSSSISKYILDFRPQQ